MRIGEVIGRVTLARCHPDLQGAVWTVVVPLSRAGLTSSTAGRGEPIVVFDELGADLRSKIAISDGAEASAPFHPRVKPIDAYCAALLDEIRVTPPAPPAQSILPDPPAQSILPDPPA